MPELSVGVQLELALVEQVTNHRDTLSWRHMRVMASQITGSYIVCWINCIVQDHNIKETSKVCIDDPFTMNPLV